MHTTLRNDGRKQHKHLFLFTALLFSLVLANTSCRAQTKARSATTIVGGGCDGCELIYDGMPRQLSWKTAIASPSEPGERMEISGTIYQVDGKTPASNVILYVYHTDAKGLYSPAPDATGPARRHGHLRGWMKTNERGDTNLRASDRPTTPTATFPPTFIPALKSLIRMSIGSMSTCSTMIRFWRASNRSTRIAAAQGLFI
jgi:hypothetical protein